jgi:DNA/RNA endonuclease YhcR with UshA esterase domain
MRRRLWPSDLAGRRGLPAAPVLLLIGALSGLTGCEGVDDRHLFSLDGTGTVRGIAFLDLNRDGLPSGGEALLEGVQVRILLAGSGDTVASVTTDEAGEFQATDLTVGSYELAAAGPLLGDTLVMTGTVPERVQITPQGTAQASVGISFPLRSIAEARATVPGRRLYVEGVLLNTRGSLPGNAVHVWDGERALRVVDVAPFNATLGDSVRILGRTQSAAGQRILSEATAFRLAELPEAEPVPVTSLEARNARQGALDAALVAVGSAVVSEVRAVVGAVLVTISDGSGSLTVHTSGAHLNQAGILDLRPGDVLSAKGLLLPQAGGAQWELHTRSGADLALQGQGMIFGRVFFDWNGSRSFDEGDAPMTGVRVRIFRSDDPSTSVAQAVSGAAGGFQIGPLEVGTYQLRVDEASIADTVVVRAINPGSFSLVPGESVQISVAIGHPTVTTDEARDLPQGLTVFIEGSALNDRGALGDNSVHLRDATGALRAVPVEDPVAVGNQVRLRGRTSRAAGQLVLSGVAAFVQAVRDPPAPVLVGTNAAASAGGGALDAELVLIREATVGASEGDDQNWVVTLDDGGGPVEVFVRLQRAGLTQAEAEETFAPGRQLTVEGLLIPLEGADRWRVHTRAPGDVVLVE